MEKNVTIYSTPTCHFCHDAKAFFDEKGVKYTNIDVSADPAKRQEMIELTGQMGVPVIRIDDDVVVGYDQKTISQLLGITA